MYIIMWEKLRLPDGIAAHTYTAVILAQIVHSSAPRNFRHFFVLATQLQVYLTVTGH
jgi:hypothetical protein